MEKKLHLFVGSLTPSVKNWQKVNLDFKHNKLIITHAFFSCLMQSPWIQLFLNRLPTQGTTCAQAFVIDLIKMVQLDVQNSIRS